MAVILTYTEDGKFKKHVSDSNKYIRKIGTEEIYSEAIDLIESEWEYEETDEEIPVLEEPKMLEVIE